MGHHRPVRRRPSPRRPALRAGLLCIVFAAPLWLGADLDDPPPPLRISVQGRPHLVAPDATLGALLRGLRLAPRPGRLLSVSGRVLDRRAEPGVVLLDGRRADPATPLATGDAIVVVDGVDRTEGTRVERRIVRRPALRNPAFTLERSRQREVRIVREISGEVLEVRSEPIARPRRPRAVALTFDDGPWPGTTLRIVRTLRRMRAEATFFMVGSLMDRYPEIVERVARAGMTIGTHSWSHPSSLRRLRPHRVETEIRAPAELLRERFGIRPTLFRPPSGAYGPLVVRAAYEAGMRVVLWGVDPRDYRSGARPAEIAREVLERVRPGSIVLLHDGGGDGEITLRALPRIVRGIRRMGLELVAVPG